MRKGKDCEDPNSYRLITLLNSDYKNITKLLANRFNVIATHFIHPDQNGFIAGRQLGTNTHYLVEAPDYFETQNISALVLLLDAKKAFDLMVWETLFFILLNCGIPPKITGLIQKLYLNAEANIIINASVVGKASVKRGLDKAVHCPGCCSPFFIEPLAIAIRYNADIRPPLPTMGKLKLYADEIMLIIKGDKEVQAAFEIFEQFELLGGYKINCKKKRK